MGLDMFAYTHERNFHNWREHYQLLDWFQEIYESRYGGEFNCAYLALCEEDLDELEAVILNEFEYDDEEHEDLSQADDLEFVRKARAALAEDKTVLFHPWW